jgi:hypothetical protein
MAAPRFVIFEAWAFVLAVAEGFFLTLTFD